MNLREDAILNLVQDVVFEFDRKGTYRGIWAKEESLLAKPREEMLGKTISDILPQEQAQFYVQKIGEVLKNQKSVEINYNIDTPRGTTYFSGAIYPLNYNEAGDTVVLYAQDVTEHVRLREAFKDQQSRLNTILESTHSLGFECEFDDNNEFKFNYVSSQSNDIFGVSPEELYQNPKNLLRFVVDDQAVVLIEVLRQAQTSEAKLEWEGKVVIADGEEKWLHLQASPKALGGEKNIVQGLVLDITKTKTQALEFEEKQKMVNHQIKLASLGELAAGVGHEINNPLAVISNVIEKFQDKDLILSLTEQKYNWLLKMAKDASRRIATITDGLRTFSRTDSTELEPFRLNDTLQSTLDLIEGLSGHKYIDIRFKQEQKDCLVYGNSGRVDQVIMNLLSNSIDALEGKEDGVIEVELQHRGDCCVLSVKDNGSGIPEEHRTKIFDPFYTSKDIGKGTGIGLSLAHSIVIEHEGEISFHTSEKGTVFFVELPLYLSEED